VEGTLWQQCLVRLENELPEQQFNTWIRPLHAVESGEDLQLLAPNQFVLDWVRKHHFKTISQALHDLGPGADTQLKLDIGSSKKVALPASPPAAGQPDNVAKVAQHAHKSNLNPDFTFDSFVSGKSNQLARAASMQVGENPGGAYNPLFIYGGVGLGKTHLMHAVGNMILTNKPDARVVYLHSERFVADMVKALQHNAINEFKNYYRTADALLIDDIQFFAKKERSQEEFFHTFNALLDSQQQIILTCDRYPKEVDGIEARLRSRFGWGLTVSIEPPDFETRVAILMNKAQERNVFLEEPVAYLVARRVRSHVRDLEGALNTLFANARFTGRPITESFAQEVLRELFHVHDRLITIENIQKAVAEYYKLRVSDLLSRRRPRTIARPRQVAMALCKELTEHSLPEIGDAFGGRDHTTVLHACRKIEELCDTDGRIREDKAKLVRSLTA